MTVISGSSLLVRDVLPGRYSFGITGRGAGGKRLPPGAYALRITATPVGGGATDEEVVPFTISLDGGYERRRVR